MHISIGEPIPGKRVIQVTHPDTGDGYSVAEWQDADKFAVLLDLQAKQAKRRADEAKQASESAE